VHTGSPASRSPRGYQGYVDDNLRIEPGEINTLDLVLTRTAPGSHHHRSAGSGSGGRRPGVGVPPAPASGLRATCPGSRSFAAVVPFELMSFPGPARHRAAPRLHETVRFLFAPTSRDYTAQIVSSTTRSAESRSRAIPATRRCSSTGVQEHSLELNRVCSETTGSR
jgi:hypothetical protein